MSLSFLSISNAYALKFEYCYNKEVMDKKVEERLIEKDMFGKFNNEKFENIYYQVFSDGNAEQVIIKTDKWHKESSKNIDEEYEGENFTFEQLALMKVEVVHPLLAAEVSLRLRQLVIVVRKLQIHTPCVHIHVLAQDIRGDDGAFNVPARSSISPR